MTGPVERVPLTDEQRLSDVTLDYWAWSAETAPPGELGTVNFPAVAQMLIAELRASRAREQELQQRIDKALAELRRPVFLPDAVGDITRRVRAALTGTET